MIRVGILGTGFGSRVLLPAFKLDPRVLVTAIYGRTAETLNRIAQTNKVKAYNDYRELISAPDIDAIAIALPPPFQAEILRESAKFNKHIFAEKPVGLGAQATQHLARVLDEKKIIHALDFEFPFLPAWQNLHSKLSDIGDIQKLQINWHVKTTAYNKPSWKTDLKTGGGVLSNLACHTLHYTEWIMGPAHSLTARLSHDEAQIDAILEFGEGRRANLSVSMNTEFGNGHRLEVFGKKGSLTLENTTPDYMNGFTLKIKDGLGEEIKKYPSANENEDGRIVAVNRVIKRFVDGIQSGKCQWPNLHDGARNEFLIEACRESQASGQKLSLKEKF